MGVFRPNVSLTKAAPARWVARRVPCRRSSSSISTTSQNDTTAQYPGTVTRPGSFTGTSSSTLLPRNADGQRNLQLTLKNGITKIVPFFDFSEWTYLRNTVSSTTEKHRLSRIHRGWKTNCRELERGELRTQYHFKSTRQLESCTDADEMAQLWALWDLEGCISKGEAPAYFKDLSSVFRPLVLSLMIKERVLGVMFLEAVTRGEWKPPGFVAADVLRLAISEMKGLTDPLKQESLANYYADIFMALVDRCGTTYAPWRQNDFFSLLKFASIGKVHELYNFLVENNMFLHSFTLAQFAYRFSLDTQYKPQAMRIVYEVFVNEDIKKDEIWEQVITTLLAPLANSKAGDDGGDFAQRTWSTLIPVGFQPNLIHFTALIRYLIWHEQMDMAWQVFEIVSESELVPDSVFFNTLLDGASRNSNIEDLIRTLGLISSTQTGNAAIWNTVLHSIGSFASNEAFQAEMSYPRVIPLFQPCIRIYSRVFEMDGLMSLFPPSAPALPSDTDGWRFPETVALVERFLPGDDVPKETPTSMTYVRMIHAYLRNVQSAGEIMQFYRHFMELYMSGDQVTKKIITGQKSMVHDLCMKALTQWPHTIHEIVGIFNDMMTGHNVASEIVQEGSSDLPSTDVPPSPQDAPTPPVYKFKPLPPKPSIYSWNILLHAWITQRAGPPTAITPLMERYRVEPTLVTWNTLLAGYARMNMLNQVLTTLKGVRKANLRPDKWTMRALGPQMSIKNGKLWMEIMKEVREWDEQSQGGNS